MIIIKIIEIMHKKSLDMIKILDDFMPEKFVPFKSTYEIAFS